MIFEVPGKVVRVIDGANIVVDLDLGWHVHMNAEVYVHPLLVAPVDTAAGLAARKYAQKLLSGALVVVRSFALHPDYCEAIVLYGPSHAPRSDEGSFALAMIAAGHAQSSIAVAPAALEVP